MNYGSVMNERVLELANQLKQSGHKAGPVTVLHVNPEDIKVADLAPAPALCATVVLPENPMKYEQTAEGYVLSAVGLPFTGKGATQEEADTDFLDNLDNWLDDEEPNEGLLFSWYATYEALFRTLIPPEPEPTQEATSTAVESEPKPKTIRRPFKKGRPKHWRRKNHHESHQSHQSQSQNTDQSRHEGDDRSQAAVQAESGRTEERAETLQPL